MSTFQFKHVSTPSTKKEQDLYKVAQRTRFQIHNMDLSIVNGIRRVILSEIPTLGFMGEKDVSIVIEKNNGPLHNEFLIQRIGMIPIHFTEEEIDGFVENEWEFELNVQNSNPSILNVTTHDFKGKRNGVDLTPKEIHRLFPPNSVTKRPILITRLRQGEELAFKALVVQSTASEHASFSPVSLCSFFYVQDDAKNKDVKDILQRERNYLRNEYNEATVLQFSIEPETGLSAHYLVAKALEILRSKCETVDREINTSGSEKVTLRPFEEIPNTYDLHIAYETDTFGNLFQSLIYSEYIRNPKKILDQKYTMSYVGYYAPHPLDPTIVIRITLQNDDSIVPTREEFIQVYKQCIREVGQHLKEVYDAWLRFELV